MRPGTVTPLWISNALLFAAPLAIMGAGQTLVMLTGGIDLSVASVATGSAYLLATNAVVGRRRPRSPSRFRSASSSASSTGWASRCCASSRSS